MKHKKICLMCSHLGFLYMCFFLFIFSLLRTW